MTWRSRERERERERVDQDGNHTRRDAWTPAQPDPRTARGREGGEGSSSGACSSGPGRSSISDERGEKLEVLRELDRDFDRAGVHTAADAKLLRELGRMKGRLGSLSEGLTGRAQAANRGARPGGAPSRTAARRAVAAAGAGDIARGRLRSPRARGEGRRSLRSERLRGGSEGRPLRALRASRAGSRARPRAPGWRWPSSGRSAPRRT